MKPCKTTFAVSTDIFIPEIDQAKKMMKEKYDSKFDLQPHVTHLLFPMFEERFEDIKPIVLDYLGSLKPIKSSIGNLEIDVDRRLFKINMDSKEIREIHQNLLNMALPYRDDAVREKDIEKYNKGDFDEKFNNYLLKYGYPRVLDENHPHITVGNCEDDSIPIIDIKNELLEILNPILNKKYTYDHMKVLLHTNAKVQSDMVTIFEEVVDLK